MENSLAMSSSLSCKVVKMGSTSQQNTSQATYGYLNARRDSADVCDPVVDPGVPVSSKNSKISI